MTESFLAWLTLGRVSVLVGFAFLYQAGGIWGNPWRRVVAPLVLVGGTSLIAYATSTFHWWYLLAYPAYVLVLVQGYGVNQGTMWDKVKRRLWYGLLFGLASLCFLHTWATLSLALCQTCLACGASVLLGVSGWLDARSEETVIGMLSVCLVPFMV